jgi:catechol-2,3-dioxygenase
VTGNGPAWSIRSALVGVSDLDRSVAFYEDVTNLREILRADRMVVLGAQETSSFTLYLRHTRSATHPGQQAAGVRRRVS